MKKMTMNADLYCECCGQETPHNIDYVNDRIHRIVCETCGQVVQIDAGEVQKHFRQEFAERLFTKPARITREMQNDLNGFLHSIPHRMVSKPIRVYKEIEKHINDKNENGEKGKRS